MRKISLLLLIPLLAGCARQVDILPDVKIKDSGIEGQGQVVATYDKYDVSFDIEPNSNLSNGDKVTIKIDNYDKTAARKDKIKLDTDAAIEHTVEDLRTVKGDTEVTHDGISVRRSWSTREKELFIEQQRNKPKTPQKDEGVNYGGKLVGKSKYPSRLPNMTFSDYDTAKEYADASSQEYDVWPKAGEGYQVVFKEQYNKKFKGEGDMTLSKRKFYKYSKDLVSAYESAYEYGMKSNSEFEIEPMTENGQVVFLVKGA